MANRRKHHKVTQLPQELIDAVNERLVKGHTYTEIAEWLRQMGEPISKSAIGRYNKDFSATLDRLKIVRDQAKAIIESNLDVPATHLAEATNELALSMIMETLSSLNSLEGEKVTELLKVLPKLADASTKREALKFQFNKGVEAASVKFKESLKKELEADPELMERVIDLVEKSKEQVCNAS